jgi:hypothetical protein
VSEFEIGEFEPEQYQQSSQIDPIEVDESPEGSPGSQYDFRISVWSTVEKLVGENQEIASSFTPLSWSQFDFQRALDQLSSPVVDSQESFMEGISSPESSQSLFESRDYGAESFGLPSPQSGLPVAEELGSDEIEESVEEEVRDPDEFETENEAHIYASEVAWEILEELLAELALEDEDLGASLVDDEDKQWIVDEVVYPQVWAAMG